MSWVAAITACIGASVADMTKAETDWSRLNRAVEQMTVRLAAAQFEDSSKRTTLSDEKTIREKS
jgi:hypothetical protein